MIRITAALAALILVPALALATVAQAGDAVTPHYPDLQTRPPSQLHIKVDRASGQKLLRFTNTVANLGAGRLELLGIVNPATGTTDAYQRVYTHDEAGAWTIQSQSLVGTFSFAAHRTHNHWHFDNFADYELRNVVADGSAGSTVYASSSKVTFCIIDVNRVNNSLEHAAARTYTSCDGNSIQGISVGWGDIYAWNVAGQSLNVSGVPDGAYWLVSTADPANLLAETNDANNSAAVKIQLQGNKAIILP